MKDDVLLDKGIFWCFVLLLVWAPIPLGSNRPWAWAILEIGIFALAALWLWGYVRGHTEISPAFRKAWPVSLLLLIWLLFGLLQWIPMPIAWVRLVALNAADAYSAAATVSPGHAVSISIDPHASQAYWLRSVMLALTFWLTLLLLTRHSRIRWLAYALIASGVFQAVYGAVDMFANSLGNANGTYANRNHFANYLALCISIGIGLIISQLTGDQAPSLWINKLREIFRMILSTKAVVRLCLVVMVIGVVLSRSRMGNTAMFSSMLVAGVIALILSRHATRSMVLLIASLVVIDIFIVGTWFGLEEVKQRIEDTSLAKEDRPKVDQYILPLIKDNLLTGTGAGSFYIAFPRYRQADIAYSYEHTENDYLQIAAESGVIGLGLLGGVLALSYGAALIAHYRRHDRLMRGISFSAIMGLTAILIHATVEFNLQIPANAMMVMVLLAFCWISLGFVSRREDSRRDGRPRDSH
jgi:O-antigen ligase